MDDGISERFGRSNSMISTATSMLGANKDVNSLIIAAPVVIRGRRLRQILSVLPIDVMEVQMLAREFFSRCDLQEKYMSLDKCSETFGISCKIAQGVYSYIRTNDLLDDVPYNYARKLALLYPQQGGRSSVIEDLQEWSRIYGQTQQQGLHLHTPRKSMLQLPKLYLTFENFVEAAVYLSPRASMQQRIDLAFSIFDANGDGFVDAQEIKSVMLDSLQSNLKHNSNDNNRHLNVENMFKNEVEELINDLKSQYNSDEFSKEEFIEFARGVEFLNCFTVNKHWLRDILGDNKDNTRRARPQDAEMKNFLESICEENESIDSEQIIDLQERLRDHLVDTVDDLKTIKPKHFNEMRIERRISTAITKHLKTLKTEQDDEYQDLISGGLLDGPSSGNSNVNSMLNLNDIANALGPPPESMLNKLKGICNKIPLPSIHRTMQIIFNMVYILSLLIAYIILSMDKKRSNEINILAKLTSIGLYVCLFIGPLSRYYPFITKYICNSLTPQSRIGHFVLYFTSRESEKINAYYGLFFTIMHVIFYNIKNLTSDDGMNFMKFNTYSIFPISGIIMLIVGIILFIMWKNIQYHHNASDLTLRKRSRFTFNPYKKKSIVYYGCPFV